MFLKLYNMISYQSATTNDLTAIAALHAKSWQENYRGILTDTYLDDKVEQERLSIWSKRFQQPSDNQYVLAAKENGKLVGFTCLYGGDCDQYGTLLDNIHVAQSEKGKGIGQQLMTLAGKWAATHYPNQGLYLWVFASNEKAKGFYTKLGGQLVETVPYPLMDGSGQSGLTSRFYWPSPISLAT
ncbi:MAG: GNAT family N-acetyltransferase [Bacteroidota bacterium]